MPRPKELEAALAAAPKYNPAHLAPSPLLPNALRGDDGSSSNQNPFAFEQLLLQHQVNNNNNNKQGGLGQGLKPRLASNNKPSDKLPEGRALRRMLGGGGGGGEADVKESLLDIHAAEASMMDELFPAPRSRAEVGGGAANPKGRRPSFGAEAKVRREPEGFQVAAPAGAGRRERQQQQQQQNSDDNDDDDDDDDCSVGSLNSVGSSQSARQGQPRRMLGGDSASSSNQQQQPPKRVGNKTTASDGGTSSELLTAMASRLSLVEMSNRRLNDEMAKKETLVLKLGDKCRALEIIVRSNELDSVVSEAEKAAKENRALRTQIKDMEEFLSVSRGGSV